MKQKIKKLFTHNASRVTYYERGGFTLIEIAIVLVVLGMLIALGAALMGPLTKRSKVIDSREAVKGAKESVSGYAVKYGYLPATIGPSGARELDAWGRALSYAADTTLLLTSTNACNRTNTDRTIFECTNTACTTSNTKSNIAFIVYSTGEDAEGTATTTQPTGGPACLGGTCYWIREQASSYTVGPSTYYYDDIVQYVALDEIRSLRGCSFIITNQTLPDAKTGTLYNVTLQASGGQTLYSWSVSGQTAGTFGCTNTCAGTCNAAGTCSTGLNGICSFPITTGPNTGLCLNSNSTAGTGVLFGTPTAANVYNFTVTVTDANAVTTSKAFTLNVNNPPGGLCAVPGIIVTNNLAAGNRSYRKNGICTTPWTATQTVTVLPTDTILFYSNANCNTQTCTTSPALSYSYFQSIDNNQNCSISWTAFGANCAFSDL